MNIDDVRIEIDNIDDEIKELFKKRMEIVDKVTDIKRKNNTLVLDQNRERAIISRITENEESAAANNLRLLFSTIFSISRAHQSAQLFDDTTISDLIKNVTTDTFPTNVSVACQGIEGAYSQIACDKVFAYPNILYFENFENVFSAVEKGLCKYGILPIENSSNGSVGEVYDLMKRHDFYIARSVKLHINHCLLLNSGANLENVREIVSHEQAIGQCSEFIKSLPNVKITVCKNTAVAAKLVSESGRNDIAAISSPECARLYGLEIAKRNIGNTDNNYTRFICISKELEIYPGATKTSLMLTVPHRPGALFDVLSKLAALGVNLTKLESRPIVGYDFEFMFYFDLDTGCHSDEMLKLLDEFNITLELFKFLGSYSEV